MSKIPTHILIPKRGKSCKECSSELKPNDKYVSILWPGPNEGEYLREDICDTCWQKYEEKERNRLRKGGVGFWKSRVPKKVDAVQKTLSKDEMVAYLHECLAKDTPEDLATAQILALFLARTKRFHPLNEIALEGQRKTLYEDRETEEVIAVPVRHYSDEELLQVRQKLNEKFTL